MAASPVLPASPASPAPQAPLTEVPRLSEGARILNTFIAPSKTFTDLQRKASWWGPFVLLCLVIVLFMVVLDRQIGFTQVTKNEMAKSPKRAEQFDKLPPEQKAQQLEFAVKITKGFSYA